ncbi:hypothetical protein J6590_008636 [Homalodisca vitripennis]|nr:hypothetical protein J6590_008636 [Homalodisca vitripennis]
MCRVERSFNSSDSYSNTLTTRVVTSQPTRSGIQGQPTRILYSHLRTDLCRLVFILLPQIRNFTVEYDTVSPCFHEVVQGQMSVEPRGWCPRMSRASMVETCPIVEVSLYIITKPNAICSYAIYRRFKHTGHGMFWKRRRYLVAFLAFLGFFTAHSLRWNLVYALGPMRTPYNVTLDNGTVVEVSHHNQ